MSVFRRIKDRLYYEFVEKKPAIKRDYQSYVDANKCYHRRHRWKSWKYLWELNSYYRKISGNNKPVPPMPVAPRPEQSPKASPPPKPAPQRKQEPPPKPAPQHKQEPPPLRPFLDGAESAAAKRIEPNFFAKTLLSYEVVSFDVFDTLILRPFTSPKDLFYVLQDKFKIFNFHKIRIEAEKTAREKAQLLKGNREINIYDIYQEVSRITGIDAETGAEAEIQAELDLCRANPYMKRVYNILKGQEKRIIIVSDMYLPSGKLSLLLEKAGYTGYERIFVSCEHNVNKVNMKLFDVVGNAIGISGGNIVHVGDNYVSDIKNARTAGWRAVHYPNVNELGNKYRATFAGMSEIIGGAYGGIVNTHLLNGIKQYSPAYEYGFMYGGIYVLGYCAWLIQKARGEGLSKLLLLSRDGAIYQKIINLLAPEIETEYVYWSRCAYTRYLAYTDRAEFLTRIVAHRKNDIYPFSIKKILLFLGLEEMLPLIKAYNLEPTDNVIPQNSKQFENFFIDNWNKVIELFSANDSYKHYFEKIVGSHAQIGVVDVGWQGSSVLGVKELIENKYNIPCRVKCFLVGSKAAASTGNMTYLLDDSIEVYAFSRLFNRTVFDYFAAKNKCTNTACFELFTQAESPTFYSLERDNDGVFLYSFGIPECENREMISGMHNGIFDFCKLYIETFKRYPFLLNISGHDAMIPFMHITSSPKFILEQLGDFAFSRNLIIDFDAPHLESVADLFNHKGWTHDKKR